MPQYHLILETNRFSVSYPDWYFWYIH